MLESGVNELLALSTILYLFLPCCVRLFCPTGGMWFKTKQRRERRKQNQTLDLLPSKIKNCWWLTLLQESPSFNVAVLCFYLSGKKDNITSIVTRIFLWLFLVHYVQRSFIYPLLIRGGKPFPFSTFIMAFQFCVMNRYLQDGYLALAKPYLDP